MGGRQRWAASSNGRPAATGASDAASMGGQRCDGRPAAMGGLQRGAASSDGRPAMRSATNDSQQTEVMGAQRQCAARSNSFSSI